MWQSIKKKSIIGSSCSPVKLFMMQNYTDNSHGDVPLTVEIACYFQFSFN